MPIAWAPPASTSPAQASPAPAPRLRRGGGVLRHPLEQIAQRQDAGAQHAVADDVLGELVGQSIGREWEMYTTCPGSPRTTAETQARHADRMDDTERHHRGDVDRQVAQRPPIGQRRCSQYKAGSRAATTMWLVSSIANAWSSPIGRRSSPDWRSRHAPLRTRRNWIAQATERANRQASLVHHDRRLAGIAPSQSNKGVQQRARPPAHHHADVTERQVVSA